VPTATVRGGAAADAQQRLARKYAGQADIDRLDSSTTDGQAERQKRHPATPANNFREALHAHYTFSIASRI
jgi:hypothetical protein